MTRRAFSVALASLAAVPLRLRAGNRFYALRPGGNHVTLIAHAGAYLPRTLSITPASHWEQADANVLEATENTFAPEAMRNGWFEMRTYRAFSPREARCLAARLARLFPRAGIRPSLEGVRGADLTYLIPFEDLTARDRAWTVLTADPEWTGTQFLSYHFGLYRAA